MEAVLLNKIGKTYQERETRREVLREIELSVEPGEFVAITGDLGAGKSTLLNMIGGLIRPSAGNVLIDGIDITRMSDNECDEFRWDHIGIVYQRDNFIPSLSILENVMLCVETAGRNNAEEHAIQLLDEVGLLQRIDHKPAQLSSSERRRAAIAAALANEPSLLLVDELTDDLAGEPDAEAEDKIMDLITVLSVVYHLTLFLATRNLIVAARAPRQVNIVAGRLYENVAVHI